MASSSAIPPKEKYDVFISFRGADTRETFISHLEPALKERKINTFIDYKLEIGEELGVALLKAIEESKIYVVIFSKYYAYSTWCLKELAHIMECEGRNGRHVIPVFYRIDPSAVRKQKQSYETAFAEHEQKLGVTDEVLKWKGALRKAADIKEFDSTSKTVRDDNDLVEQIVTEVLTKLKHECTSNVPDNLVGVEARIESIVRGLDNIPNDSRAHSLVIWGMGGIGKTTLADAVFHSISSQFEACCFLANVRERSGAEGNLSPQLYDLRNELLGQLLDDKDIKIRTLTLNSYVKKRLNRTKVLVVLDDVNHSSQLEFLAGGQVPYGPGSRIIITTPSMQLVEEMQAKCCEVKTYEVKELNGAESRQFFHSNSPTVSTEFLDRVMGYTPGIPSVLKELSRLFLPLKSQEEVEQKWDKLRKSPRGELQNVINVYRSRFNGLKRNEREIFLDIACFHKGKDICTVKSILALRGLLPENGIRILIDMSLISIKPIKYDHPEDDYDCIWMHGVIQEMGVDIVKGECAKEPGNRSRLHKYKDIFHVLKNNTGTSTVHSIHLDFGETVPDSDKLDLDGMETPIDFRLMCNLEFLTIGDHIIIKPTEPPALPSSLKYLLWDAYVPESLHFSPENLVELHMPHSQLQRLWNEDQNPVNLKIIDLSYSYELVEVVFLSNCVNIERINLKSCVRVQVLDLTKCVNIKSINLRNCKSLAQVPDMSNSVNIESVDLREWDLETVPLYFENFAKLTYLKLDDSIPPDIPSDSSTQFIISEPNHLRGYFGITTISSECMTEMSELSSIDLQHCCFFESLPTNICKFKYLQSLNLSGCIRFRVFPEIWEPMESLKYLNLCGTGIEKLPSTFANLVGIERLNLSFCSRLRLLPDCFHNWLALESLVLSGTKIETLPPTIKRVLGLKYLILIDCKQLQSLPELPCRLKCLDASGCTSLKTVSVSVTDLTPGLDQIFQPMLWSERHSFTGCINLDTSARSNIMDDAHQRIMRMATVWNKRSLNEHIDNIYDGKLQLLCDGSEIPKWLKFREQGCSMNMNLHPYRYDTKICLGLALSTVVSLGDASGYNDGGLIKCQMIFKTNNNIEVHRVNLSSGSFDKLVIGRDNVLVWYTNFSAFPIQGGDSFHFRVTDYHDETLPNICVRKCGVSFLYANDDSGNKSWIR